MVGTRAVTQAAVYLLDHVVGILPLAKVRQLEQSPSPSRQCLVNGRAEPQNLLVANCCILTGQATRPSFETLSPS